MTKKTESKLMIAESDLSKVEESALSVKQLNFLLQKTPEAHIYDRPAKGGGKWRYVTGTYFKKVLNLMFGFDWSFEVIDHKFDLNIKQAYVLGKLTCNSNGKSIVKMQFGRQDIKFKVDWIDGVKTPTDIPLDLGNDLKAATTDALKKCASELGIASDIYAPNEFKAVTVLDDEEYASTQLKTITDLLSQVEDDLQEHDLEFITTAIEESQVKNYGKIIKVLKNELQKRAV